MAGSGLPQRTPSASPAPSRPRASPNRSPCASPSLLSLRSCASAACLLQSIPPLVMESHSIKLGPCTAHYCLGSVAKASNDAPVADDTSTDCMEDSDSCSTSSSSHFDFSAASGAEAATKDSEQPPSGVPEPSLTLPLPRRGQPMYPEVAGMYVRAAETPRSVSPSPCAMYVRAHLTPR